MSRSRSSLFGVAGTALLAASCSRAVSSEAPPPPPPTPVSVWTVTARELPATFRALGRTEGSRDVEIRARVGGFLERRLFVEGDAVESGALLFELDRRPLEAARIAAAAEVETAEARLAQAAREAARLRPLVADRAASEREADNAEAAERVARAELATAQARLQQIDVDLGYTRVTAPIAGRIGLALRAEGSLVSPENGLLTTLVQLDPLYVRFHRTETQQSRFDQEIREGRLTLPESGLRVEIRDSDGTPLLDGGTLDFEDDHVDPRTGTVLLRATLPNPGQKVLAGRAVEVLLHGAVRANAIAIPQRAVLEGPLGKQVLVVAAAANGPAVVEARPIEVGEWIELEGDVLDSQQWIVNSGLAPGDRVILDNLMKLGPGVPVVVEPATASPAGR